jgi:hypothetical protein
VFPQGLFVPAGGITNLDTTDYPGDYFVDPNLGNDANSGTSYDQPWKTIAKVNGFTFAPMDTISFRKEGAWRETLTVPHDSLTFMSYGTGNKPKILGSEQALNFADCGGNVWKSATSLLDPYNIGASDMEIWFEEPDDSIKWGTHQTDTASLTAEYHWTWLANYIYVYAITDPDTRYSVVECGQRYSTIDLNSKQDIEINSLDLFYSVAGIDEDYPTEDLIGLTIRNCEIGYLGGWTGWGYGIHAVYNNSLFEDNEIHDCGRRGISLVNYGTHDITNIVVQDNTIYNCYHTTGVDIETGTEADDTGDIDSIIIRNNYFFHDSRNYNTRSGGVFLQENTGSTGKITSTYIYNNIFVCSNGNWVGAENVDSVYVYNNIFYGLNQVLSDNLFHIAIQDPVDDCLEWKIKNNIFYNNRDLNWGTAIILENTQDYTEIDADYNLYYTSYSARPIIYANSTAYTMAQWSTMKMGLNWEANSPIPSDLLLYTDSFNVRYGSSAIDSGLTIALIADDYYDIARGTPPTIGAVEIFTYGDTIINFEASSTKKDTILIATLGYISQPDSLRLVADMGNDSIGIGGGTLLYAGHDTTIIEGQYKYEPLTDTIVRVELWQEYFGVWSYYANHDTTFVDSTASNSTLLTGLISYYKLDETSGNTIDIAPTSPHDGTVTGATQNVTGKINKAYSFDGTNDYIDFGSVADFRFTTAMSISFWVTSDAYYGLIIGNHNEDDYQGWQIDCNGSGGVVRFTCNTSGADASITSTNVVYGVGWVHIVATYDGAHLKLYYNGVSDATEVDFTATIDYGSVSPNTIIGVNDQLGNDFTGDIDGVGLWNKTLIPTEVTELYTKENSGATFPWK